MARIRSIHPDALENDKLIHLSDGAERTYWRLLTQADDEGRGKDGAELLASKLYPADTSKTAEIVDADLDELVAARLLERYEVDGRRYYEIHDFTDWQNPRHPTPSKIPAPSEGTTVSLGPNARSERRNDTAERRTPTGRSGTDNAPEPEAGVGVEKEVGEGGGEPSAPKRRNSHHDLLPPGASPVFLTELDQIIDALIVVYEPEQVARAVAGLLDRGLRFPFPSKVRQALEAGMTAPATARPTPLDESQRAQQALMTKDRSCPTCDGSGWADPDDDGVTLPCPACRPEDARLQEAS